jgi:hypothetical protein
MIKKEMNILDFIANFGSEESCIIHVLITLLFTKSTSIYIGKHYEIIELIVILMIFFTVLILAYYV